MLVVPLKSDKIETNEGVTFTVLSYTNYRDKGPAVYVEHTQGVPSDAVYFFDINRINGHAVEYLPGPKLFRAMGDVKRRYHLPQIGDTITYRDGRKAMDMTITGLKLHKKDSLSKGLLLMGHEEGVEEKTQVRLSAIIDLKRDIGNDLFSRDKFMTYYSDYLGAQA